MPYRKHPRHMTNEQFSDGTTVDGSRLDHAMESIERHFNQIPQGDVRSKWVPTTYVMGWLPNAISAAFPDTHNFPWLEALNDDDATDGTEPDTYANPLRAKGFAIPDVDAVNGASNHTQFQWMTAFAFARPAIITHLDIMLIIDHETDPAAFRQYGNTFQYGAPAPHGFASGDGSQDFNFSLHVDSPTGPEDRQLNNIEISRHSFNLKLSRLSNLPWPNLGAFADFEPRTFPGGGLAGVLEPIEGCVPVHRDSRVRLTLTIPPSMSVTDQYFSSWGGMPWYNQQFHVAMHVLEELV